MFNIDDEDEQKVLNFDYFYVSYFDSVAQQRIYYFQTHQGLIGYAANKIKIAAKLVDSLTGQVMRAFPARNITVEPVHG